MYARSYLLIVPVLLCPALIVTAQETNSETAKIHTQVCRLWESRVDSTMKINDGEVQKKVTVASTRGSASPYGPNTEHLFNVGGPNDPDKVKGLSEEESLDAIACLLDMEGNIHQSRFGTYVQPQVSQVFAPAQSNLSALYYISYIYTGNWQHAGAIALRGKGVEAFNSRGEYLTRREAVAAAYKAYREWLAEVKRVGLGKSRNAGLDPLAGTGMEWYGPVQTLKQK